MIPPGHTDALRATETLARIAVATGTQQLEAQPLLEVLERFDARAFREVFVGVDSSFSWLGVQCVYPRGAAGASMVEYLAEFHPAHHAAAQRVLQRGLRAELIELRLAADRSITASVHSVGQRPWRDDAQAVSELSELSPDATQLLTTLAEELGRRGPCQGLSVQPNGAMSLYFLLPNDSAPVMARTIATLDAIAAGLQVSQPQRDLFRASHQPLSQGKPVIASVRAQNGSIINQLDLDYPALAWDDALRLFQGLHPATNPARKLGALSGACQSPHTDRLRIALGPIEPPTLEAWAALGTE